MLNNINKHKSQTTTVLTGIDNFLTNSLALFLLHPIPLLLPRVVLSLSLLVPSIEKDNCKIKQRKGKRIVLAGRKSECGITKTPNARWGNFMVQRF